jgi:hypothetical protein
MSVAPAGYFDGSATGLWQGTEGLRLGVEPQYGPSCIHDRLGMTLIGATPWIVNFNVLVQNVTLPDGAPCHSASCLKKRSTAVQLSVPLMVLQDHQASWT